MVELLTEHIALLGDQVEFASTYRSHPESTPDRMLHDLIALSLHVFDAIESRAKAEFARQPGDWKAAARSTAPQFSQWYAAAQRVRDLARHLKDSGRAVANEDLSPLLRAMNTANCYGPSLERYIAANNRVDRGEHGTPLERLEDELQRRTGG